MANLNEQIEEHIGKVKREADLKKAAAREAGSCAVCGNPISPTRLARGSYTCSDKCSMEFLSLYDYSKNSQAVKEIKKKYREQSNKNRKERKTEGVSTARKEAQCGFCEEPILPGEKYSWRVPQPYEDDWDDFQPFRKYKWHIECENHLQEIFKILDLGDDYDFLDVDTEEALEYAAVNGGIRHFKEGTWSELPVKEKLTSLGDNL